MSLAFAKPQTAKRRAKVLLIGDAGSGKTHAALTFPKPAVIDAEGSSGWFADRFTFDAVATKSYKDVAHLVRQMRSRPGEYETLVIDSLTSIYSSLVNAASADREDLRLLDWGRIKRKFSQLLDEMYHQLPMNVVCIGWVKPEYAKAGDVVNGKTVGANDLIKLGEVFDGDRKTMYAFDFVFRLYVDNGKFSAVVVKSRSGELRQGQRIANFSWDSIKGLVGNDDGAPGMTDDEQVSRDRGVLEDAPKPPEPPRDTTTYDRAAKLGITDLRAWCADRDVPWRQGPITMALDQYEADKARDASQAPEPALMRVSPVEAVSNMMERDAAPAVSASQRGLAMTLHGKLGHSDEDRRAYYHRHWRAKSFRDLTPAQVSELISFLNADIQEADL